MANRLTDRPETFGQVQKPLRLPVLYGFLAAAVVVIGLELVFLPNLASNPGFLALIIFTSLVSFGSIGLTLSGLRSRLPRPVPQLTSLLLWGLVGLDLLVFLVWPNFSNNSANDAAPTFVSSNPLSAATVANSSNPTVVAISPTSNNNDADMSKSSGITMVKPVTANLPPAPNMDKKRPAPDFDNEVWLNSSKLSLAALKGKVVLVEFWTFGCVNCQNVQPALKSYYENYASKGLEIVGFHAPEFDYEKKLENVQTAVKERGLKYPVALDNDFKTWNKYGVRAWPTMYLLDKQGQIRYSHIGEGEYGPIEAAIVKLLNEEAQ